MSTPAEVDKERACIKALRDGNFRKVSLMTLDCGCEVHTGTLDGIPFMQVMRTSHGSLITEIRCPLCLYIFHVRIEKMKTDQTQETNKS